jgi:hypothetical protein
MRVPGVAVGRGMFVRLLVRVNGWIRLVGVPMRILYVVRVGVGVRVVMTVPALLA